MHWNPGDKIPDSKQWKSKCGYLNKTQTITTPIEILGQKGVNLTWLYP